MTEPIWLTVAMVQAFHLDQIREHHGPAGIRDDGLLVSALQRPKHRWHYEPESDFASLAAAYGFGIARNHPFVDGNKRVALLAMIVFLRVNGLRFAPSQEEAVRATMRLADGSMNEAELADWIRAYL